MGSENYDAPRHAHIFKQLQYAYFPVRDQDKMHCVGREYDEMDKH